MTPPPMENLCRICIRRSDQKNHVLPLVCVFGTTIELDQRQSGQEEEEEEDGHPDGSILIQTVAQAMASCLDVEIKPTDSLPQRICSQCLGKLKESWALKETCKASEKQLRQMLHGSEVKQEVGKQEVLSDEEDLGQDVCFVDEDEDEKVVEEGLETVSPAKEINLDDPLHSEFGWLFSELPKGRFRVKPGDGTSWDLVEVEDHRCCGCFKFFDSKDDLEEHCKRDHKEELAGRNKRYECSACLKLFATTDALSFHQKLARSRQLFRCKLCQVLSPSKRQLKTHLKLHADNKLNTVSSKQEPKTAPAKAKPVADKKRQADGPPPAGKCREVKNFVTFDYMAFDGFCCCDCGTYCETKREMKRHGEKEHFGNRGFEEEQTCFACWRSFEDKSAFEQHMADLNSKQIYYCKICRLTFRNSDQLQDHQQTSANHEGFIELDGIDIKEEVEPVLQITAMEVESPTTDDEHDVDYDPSEGGSKVQDFLEPYGRRLYAPPKMKRSDQDSLTEVSVVEISRQDAVRCCGCYRTFITEEEVVDHCGQQHEPFRVSENKELPYECERCYRRFGKAVSLQIHQQFIRSVQEYSCKLCEQKFSFQTPFLLHLGVKHEYSALPTKPRKGAQNKTPDKDTKFHCCFLLCKQTFDEYGDLLCHVDEHHGVKRNQFKDYRDSDENCCEICFRSFNNYGALLRHVMHHRRTRLAQHTCSTCGVQVKSLTALKDHENKHLGIKPYECEVCQKTFGTKNILKNHMLVHVKDRPFSCEICGKTFARKRNWKDHSMTHLDAKPWECEICKLTFRIETQFMTHKKRHTGVRPYKCSYCDKVFSHATDRKRHQMAAHTGEKPHQCSFCPLAFIRKRQLVIHERTHTGEKPFECPYCTQAFIQQSYLTRHLATHKQQQLQQPQGVAF